MIQQRNHVRGVQLTSELYDQARSIFEEELLPLVEKDLKDLEKWRLKDLELEEGSGSPPAGPVMALGSAHYQQEIDNLNARVQAGAMTRCTRGFIQQRSGASFEWRPQDMEWRTITPLTHELRDVASASVTLEYESSTEGKQALTLSQEETTLSIVVEGVAWVKPGLLQRLSAFFESKVTEEAKRALKLSTKIFIGHGGDRKWEVVRDFIEHAGYEHVAFESADRVGQGTYYSVRNMIAEARLAVVIMTAADELRDGTVLARQNVVHEIGLAQGILGADNTIIVKEDGVPEFSNIAGMNQIRVPNGNLHAGKNEILASIKAKLEKP